MSEIRELIATDDTFREVADLLFGAGGDELISKMNPAQSDLASHDRKKRAITAGLSAVGATAGAAGLGYAAHKTGGAYRLARAAQKTAKAGEMGFHAPGAKRAAAKAAIKHESLGSALIPLEVAGLGGEVMATNILHGDTKKKTVSKMSPKQAVAAQVGAMAAGGGLAIGAVAANNKRHGRKWNDGGPRRKAGSTGGSFVKKNDVEIPTKRGVLVAVATDPRVQKKAKKGVGQLRGLSEKVITKRDEIDVVWEGEFAKADADKQQVFGWASVVEIDGEPVVDLQGDYISPEEMEKAGYEYVMKSREGGDMHLRDDWKAIKKSEMIESFIVTDEKKQAMGLPDSVPTGWWVGFQVQDPEVWAKVKSGERTGFSIHGTGKRA